MNCIAQRLASIGAPRPWLLALALLAFGQQTFAQGSICGPIQNAYGPYDYRKDRDKLPIVDSNHFTTEVETLIQGKTGPIGGDLDYTLRAFPNHHRALLAMMRLGEREKAMQTKGAQYSVECYFERAIRFVRDDTVVRSLYATFLAKAGRRDDALAQLQQATFYAADNPFAHYNIGLVYLELKQYDKALEQAHRAMELDFPRTALADGLKQAGHWREPTPASPSPSSSAASAAASAAGAKP